jgi:ATP-dependent protease HslVU (ClpYQ) peptidase subunit
MTVIAWDGKTLAADRRVTTGDGAITTGTKIWRLDDALVGYAGDGHTGRELLAWWKEGADPKDFPASAREDKASLVVVRRTGIEQYVSGPQPFHPENERMAWGCGRDFALAVLALGHDARRAVEIASELSAYCGNGVDTLTLE